MFSTLYFFGGVFGTFVVYSIGRIPMIGSHSFRFFVIKFGTRELCGVGSYSHYNANSYRVTHILQGFKFGGRGIRDYRGLSLRFLLFRSFSIWVRFGSWAVVVRIFLAGPYSGSRGARVLSVGLRS